MTHVTPLLSEGVDGLARQPIHTLTQKNGEPRSGEESEYEESKAIQRSGENFGMTHTSRFQNAEILQSLPCVGRIWLDTRGVVGQRNEFMGFQCNVMKVSRVWFAIYINLPPCCTV
jgi:hypothetical protein